jgi:hypothetical protein
MAAIHSAWNNPPRLPLDLLDDTERRGLRLDQLRAMVEIWVANRPTAPVPRTVDELVEALVA